MVNDYNGKNGGRVSNSYNILSFLKLDCNLAVLEKLAVEQYPD